MEELSASSKTLLKLKTFVFALYLSPAGMQALFEIKKCFPNVHKPRPHGTVREFFIAAEEDVWDYAPMLPSERLANQDTNRHVHSNEAFCTHSVLLCAQ